MSEVSQTILAGRDDGVPGNCIQAAVASLLDLPLDAVPHVLLWNEWNYVLAEWLAERGYTLNVRLTAELPSEGWCIAAGMSPRDVSHVCVAADGQIVWDPHPSRDGLTRIDEIWIITPAGVLSGDNE